MKNSEVCNGDIMSKGILITVDGLDGSGKETQTKLLCRFLEENGIKHRYVSFPTYKQDSSALLNMYLQGAFGSDPAAVNAYAASSFFAMDRYCSYMLDWKQDYENGAVIIANRYTTANLVHQMSKLPIQEREAFMKWLYDYEFGCLGLPAPDLVMYLCLPPEVSESLIQKRCDTVGAVRDIHENSKQHLRDSYDAAVYTSEKLGWSKIDCAPNGVLRSIEDISEEVKSVVLKAGILPERR